MASDRRDQGAPSRGVSRRELRSPHRRSKPWTPLGPGRRVLRHRVIGRGQQNGRGFRDVPAPGWFGFVKMLVFVGILMLGFLYIWNKRGLEWE